MNRKYYLMLLAVVLCTLQLMAQDKVNQIRGKFLNRDESSVIVASHRGDWRNFPENSLAAIDHVIAMGVDIVEIDLQRTKDGVLILMHDAKLDRTTNGKGPVSEIVWDSIAQLNLKNGCGIVTRYKVPTLEEVLVHAKGKIMLNLDKADRYFDEVYALLVKTGTARQIIMKGKKPVEEVKRKFGDYLDEVIYMPVIGLDNECAEEMVRDFCKGLQPYAFELTLKNGDNPLAVRMGKYLKGKSLVWYNTLWPSLCGGHDDDIALEDPDGAYGYLIDTLGCRIIQTDRPQYLIDYLRKRGLHE